MTLKNAVGWETLETAKKYLDDKNNKNDRDDYRLSL